MVASITRVLSPLNFLLKQILNNNNVTMLMQERRFPNSLQENSMVAPQIGLGTLLPHSSHLIILPFDTVYSELPTVVKDSTDG
jgi:hypothetical protein